MEERFVVELCVCVCVTWWSVLTGLYKTFICPVSAHEHTQAANQRKTIVNEIKLPVCSHAHSLTVTVIAQRRPLPLAAQPSVTSWTDPRDAAWLTDWRQCVSSAAELNTRFPAESWSTKSRRNKERVCREMWSREKSGWNVCRVVVDVEVSCEADRATRQKFQYLQSVESVSSRGKMYKTEWDLVSADKVG